MDSQVLTTKDSDQWRIALPISDSVYGSVEYAIIHESYTSFSANLFIAHSDDGSIAYPFFLRPIQSLPFPTSITATQWDTFTPEYTGPICRGKWSPELASFFTREFAAYCRDQRIVAEFAHLHPWNVAKDVLSTSDVKLDREIVFVDITQPTEELWRNHFTYACRKNIKRTQSAGIRVFPASTIGNIEEFYRIYNNTMDRRQAASKYYFSLQYFVRIFEHMPDNSRFVLAESAGRVIAATLYLYDNSDVYSYLGGADHAFQQIRPTNAVVYDTILWAHSCGKKRLVLGGGYNPDDGIFKFKASFSPMRAQFKVYRHIHLPKEYEDLCNEWSAFYKANPDSYFPAYRSVPVVNSNEANR